MAYYRECPFCHASLDPNEKCDCFEKRKHKREMKEKQSELASMETWEQLKLPLVV